ncbi:dTDP-4-dehydrorhamnose reductase [Flexilinea flocculi]|uniref:dTDP-4-dehydrorhamnose reductase n=1 Tax=Flexilinea flocculi TaxID=1678840 RepID=A0A0K8PAD2_9CHLR|nr:dTDP-4-dehydrorhamnose reductase [Flexilinea flocculi]GAP39479.1 dTDP-4-dehydrorhamnose reductase [Flexilinea flocculi]
MKILLIGEKGQLAWELIRTLMPVGEVVSVDYPQFDISDKTQIADTVKAVAPDIVINASAYTNVDLAETEKEKAMAINADGPGWLAAACASKKIPLIHYSTDFVFDGTKKTPYVETDQPNPINVYGLSKWRGEQSIQQETGSALIFRLAWLYSMRGNSFVTKFLEWAKKYETIRIVDDQIGNPTWARFVAEATAAILSQAIIAEKPLYNWFAERNGIYHLTSGGEASRYDWAKRILDFFPQNENFIINEILTAKTIEFYTPALRPPFSVLNCDRIVKSFNTSVTHWENQLRLCLQ